ncbi:unnamed protein product [Candida verbasci]|uniref:Uncharacterized protein n=1 Tax=Candida verbasci TaxID=1227364 RepID=A0A9W4TWB0_9ASCO|nr:unnamed protein product [Candida verbasci]
MSRLDKILSYVSEIELRSNKLSNLTSESNQLIDQISHINESVAKFDQDIDDINGLINSNQSSITQFNNLYEKSFYLENNLVYNDAITNQTSFEKLTQEYLYILGELKTNDRFMQSNGKNSIVEESSIISHQDQEFSNSSTPTPTPPNLKQMISISNLKLKPMRCTSSESKQIAKKKSRYRLSSIYNINPIAYEDSTISSEDNDFDDSTNMINSVSNSYETLNSIHHDNDILDTKNNMICTPPRAQKGRSNSVPTTKSNMSLTESDIFKDLDCENEMLQFNRLKHFVSFNHLPHDDEDLFFNEFMKSPTPNCEDNFDMTSVISDISHYSPDNGNQEVPSESFCFDNFDQFLRNSKTDLNKDIERAFPHLIRPKEQEQEPRYKFQNPVQMSTSHIATPILDSTYHTTMSSSPRKSASSLLISFVDKSNPPALQPSFTDTLFSLVSKPSPVSTKPTTPQKIKELKKQKRFKTNPISIPNEIQKKRIPPQPMSITIPKVNEFYVNHHSSVFKNPIVRSYNKDALREALANSLLD